MTRLADTDLAAARALVDAATAGPWTTPDGSRLQGAVSATIDGFERQVAGADGQAAMFDARRDLSTADVRDANARFIAASRTLVPALLDEIDALKRELADVAKVVGGQGDEVVATAKAYRAALRVTNYMCIVELNALIAAVDALAAKERAR